MTFLGTKFSVSVGMIVLCACCWHTLAFSQTNDAEDQPSPYTPTPAEDSLWYYEIGGAQAITRPANPNVTSMTLGGTIELGTGLQLR